jgi:outer membrane protein assembly factor BamB
VVLVTTSERWVIAYTDAGVRLWQLSLDEIASAPPVRASNDDVVLVNRSGVVQRLRLSSGEILWRHEVGSDVKVAPAVGAGVVVVMDGGGTTTALDAETGRSTWTLILAGEAAAFLGGTLVLIQDQTAHGVIPNTGERRWLRPFSGSFNELAVVGDRVVLATQTATVMLDAEGTVTTRLPAYRRVTATEQAFVGWGSAEAGVVSASGALLRRLALPGLMLAQQDWRTVALPDGVLLTNADWTFSIFTDER